MTAVSITHGVERRVFDLARRYLDRVDGATPDHVPPEVVLAALAQATATYLCTHFDQSRQPALAARIETLHRDMIRACEAHDGLRRV